MSNSTLHIPSVVRVLASTTYTTIGIIGLSMYAVISIAVIKHWKEIKNPFYNIFCHLAISDILFTLIFIILMAPRIFSPTSVYPEILDFILPQMHSFFALSTFLVGFTLTVERSAIFLWPRMHAELFEYGRVHFTMAATWTITGAMTIHTNAFGCHNHFDFRWYYECSDPGNMVHLLGIMLVSGTSATVMMLMYLVVFVHLKRNKKRKVATSTQEAKQQRSRAIAERNLLLQGFIIRLILQVMALSFWLAPADQAWGPVLLNLLCCINSACNPTIYFTFNKTIRDKVALLFGMQQHVPVISVKASTRTRKAQADEIQEVDQV